MVRAGKMIHRVKIYAPPDPTEQGNTDEMGQVIDDWPHVGTRWAEVTDLTGRRLYAAQQEHAETTVEVRLHYTAVVKAGYRLQHGDRLLELVGGPADPTGLRRELVCRCRVVE